MDEAQKVSFINSIMNMLAIAYDEGKNLKEFDGGAAYNVLNHLLNGDTEYRQLISCPIEQKARIEVIISQAKNVYRQNKGMLHSLDWLGPYAIDTPESFAFQTALMLHYRYQSPLNWWEKIKLFLQSIGK